MYEHNIGSHKNVKVFSILSDIERGKPNIIRLRSYENVIVEVVITTKGAKVTPITPYKWSGINSKHLNWFFGDLNSRLHTDLSYYDTKFLRMHDDYDLLIEDDTTVYQNRLTRETLERRITNNRDIIK